MSKAERQELNKSKRGANVELLKRVEVEIKGEAVVAFIPVASQNEGIRTEDDVADWMEENNFVGSVVCVSRRKWGPEKDGLKTRAEQKVMVIT